MASTAPLARSIDRAFTVDPLNDDSIGFDAWLLPPAAPRATERAMCLASCLAGPIAFVLALGTVVHWLV